MRAELLYRKAQKSIGLTEGAAAAKHELAMYLEQYAMLCRPDRKADGDCGEFGGTDSGRHKGETTISK
ncbi:hypothetical protein SAMN04487970_10277 [Paenibacillus tianmuensis]|uniref:Uncharacterized protein n=2 Tax=Paenibacillus tianmuensis TaxID=624147 RepID=A0A1G4SDV8_9BACL|nr:hypothetical protein SAMN04487970_10277 [Paenibacillus tianmuensis]